MKVTYILNNYTIGARLRMAPTHKIASQERMDRNHTQVVFELDSMREKEFCDKVFAKKGLVASETNA